MSAVSVETWLDRAECRGKPTSIFFPSSAGSSYQDRGLDLYAAARAICARCPVGAQCLEEALTIGRTGRQVDGMWGGLDEHERRALLGRRRPARRAS